MPAFRAAAPEPNVQMGPLFRIDWVLRPSPKMWICGYPRLMNLSYKCRRLAAAGGVIFVLMVGVARAHLGTGNIYGWVKDKNWDPLPGILTTLQTPDGPVHQVSDRDGRVRFLDLKPGIYTIKVELEGYGSSETSGIEVKSGQNTNLSLTLSPGVR